MIEKLKDLGLDDIDPTAEDIMEQIDKIFQEKLEVSISALKEPILSYVQSHSEELSLEFPNIAPKGDYGNLIEDNDGMSVYLKSLTAEDFSLASVEEDEKFGLLKISFICLAVDDGESFEAFSYLTKNGKIKYSFAQYCG